jgi:glycosyltransferase involved in cell wall biosynthesis
MESEKNTATSPASAPLSYSVVIPAYNAAKFLADTILSVQGQTVRPNEVIVVDDESTDNTRDIARSLGTIALRTQTNGGPAKARNIGIRASTGDVIAFLDADDLWEPDHCEELLRLLQTFPQVGLVFGHSVAFGAYNGPQARLLPDATPVSLWPKIVKQNFIPQSGCAVRRDLLLQVGAYDEERTLHPSEDYDLWLRLLRRTSVACTHRTTFRYRVHAGQASASGLRIRTAQTHARAKLLAALVAENSPDVAGVTPLIRSAWNDVLDCAWQEADYVGWKATLDLAHEVPDSAPIARSWRLRYPIWPVWRLLKRMKAYMRSKTLSQSA